MGNTKDYTFKGLTINGFVLLVINILVIPGIITAIALLYCSQIYVPTWAILSFVILGISFFLMLCGYIMLEPNEARAMLFFGKYKGSFTKTGLWWVNTFITARKVSLRALNMDIDPIKVNDKGGNPIMIGLVLVWRIKDIYKSSFEIDTKAVSFVRVQSDAALREVAGQYNYDINTSGDNEITLRSGGNDVNDQLEIKLNERLEIAGIEVIEARINYLAYAPEIAAVMLRRQQADAIIAAREKIVEGAVSMVKMALDKIANEEVVHFNEEKKAAMVSNLLVVLCADESTQPVINTGTH